MSQIQVHVTVKGPLFTKKLDSLVRNAMYEEAVEKITARMERGGKGLGARRNVVTTRRLDPLTGEASSTLHRPRTKGTAWTRKNVAIAKAMAPRVLRKAALRITSELS